jgi:Protein of unknown function (DUF1552)
MTRLNRRRLLQATGLAAGSLFLPSLIGDRRAYGAVPTRMAILFTQHGPTYDTWRMRQPGLPDKDMDWEFPLDTVAEADFSPVLQPLYAQRKNILVLDGLAMTSAFADNPGTNNHNAGTSHALTGAKMVRGSGFNGEGQGGGPSVDQVVANVVAVPGRIKSLFYSTAYKPWCPSFEGSNKPTAPECSPGTSFDRLFPAGAVPNGGPPSEADLIRQARPSVLSLVRDEYAALAPRLGTEDRQRLDQHRALIADLEAQTKGRGAIVCAAPPKPTQTGKCTGGENQTATVGAFMKLTTAAMACDLTRVAVIDSGQLANADFNGPPGDVHQDIAHAATPGSPAATQMANYYRVHATQFADLIGQFSAAGLLESTALMWITEIADGPHGLFRNMIVLAGSAGGAFRTGRYLKYKETGANPAGYSYGGGKNRIGPAHSQVLVSLMQAMGLPDNSIGIASATGDLAGSGEPVNLSGPLPRLA